MKSTLSAQWEAAALDALSTAGVTATRWTMQKIDVTASDVLTTVLARHSSFSYGELDRENEMQITLFRLN